MGWNDYRITVTWWQASENGTGHPVERSEFHDLPRGSSSVQARDLWGELCNQHNAGLPEGWTELTVHAVQIWRHTNADPDTDRPSSAYMAGTLAGTWAARFGFPPTNVDHLPIDQVRAQIRQQLGLIHTPTPELQEQPQ